MVPPEEPLFVSVEREVFAPGLPLRGFFPTDELDDPDSAGLLFAGVRGEGDAPAPVLEAAAPDWAAVTIGARSVTITGTSVGTGARLTPATAKATVATLSAAVMATAILNVRFKDYTGPFGSIRMTHCRKSRTGSCLVAAARRIVALDARV